MEKLELKHLSPYLPYGLKVLRPDNKTILEVKGINGNLLIFNEAPETLGAIRTNTNKPILRPLSDLQDKSYHLKLKSWFESEREVIISTYENKSDFTITATFVLMGETFTDCIVNRCGILQVRYHIVENLLKHHFDVFGLIEKGLAIDINTLEI